MEHQVGHHLEEQAQGMDPQLCVAAQGLYGRGRRRGGGGQGIIARRGDDDQGLTQGREVGIQIANDGVQNLHPQ